MRPGAVIAAAGIPGGFRAYEKLKNTDRNAMLRRMIRTFQRAGVEDIVIVTGYRAQETEKGLAKMGAAFLRCEDYETAQMLDFAVRGFRYLKNCDRRTCLYLQMIRSSRCSDAQRIRMFRW